jgi:hypothetical protein
MFVNATWDLASFVFGNYGNVSNPNDFIESGLRSMRDEVMANVRSRYRECASLIVRLRNPPTDPIIELFWKLRLQEYAVYLEAVTGRVVVDFNEEAME